MGVTRRRFLEQCLGAGVAAGWPVGASGYTEARRLERVGLPIAPDPSRGWHGLSSTGMALREGRGYVPGAPTSPGAPPVGLPDLGTRSFPPARSLAERFSDLPRHFVFEYYPWYGVEDYLHWDQWDRIPPDDLASNYVPRLGPYDSLSHAVLEQHARWITESGAGAVNLSWWGPGSFEDRAVNTVMDVMRDHGIKVTFHLEPYDNDRGRRYAEDVLYLLRQYGDRRRWDALLVLKDEDGTEGPVLKGFRCILPPEYTDCRGVTRPVLDYTSDDEWRRQTDTVRDTLRRDFHHVWLLADSVEFHRTPRSGFDGIAMYDPFVPPEDYARYARGATLAGLVFSFSVNAGFDTIEPRNVAGDECYQPTPFQPPTPSLDWSRAEDRERAADLSRDRILASFRETVLVQTDPALVNVPRGFFLVYVTTFNEWHEGTSFEPMRDAADLTPAHRSIGYHNPRRGDYRMNVLGQLIREALTPPPPIEPEDRRPQPPEGPLEPVARWFEREHATSLPLPPGQRVRYPAVAR